MKDLKKICTAALLSCFLAASALAADNQDGKKQPPPKEPKVIINTEKDKPNKDKRDDNKDNKERDKKPDKKPSFEKLSFRFF